MKNTLFFLLVLLGTIFSLQVTAQTYCESEGYYYEYDHITNVNYAGINNTTVNHASYNNFTNQVAYVEAGETNQMVVWIYTLAGSLDLSIFVDWNKNGNLDDAGEVYHIVYNSTSNGPHTMPIVVPEDALPGNSRMRVIAYSSSYDYPQVLCSTFDSGEVEDYTVNVSPPATTNFITTWKTDNPGTSNSTSITIPTEPGGTYNYDVDWGDGNGWETNITGTKTHDYGAGNAGTYTVKIRGNFPRIYFMDAGDKEKIITIEQWGSIVWNSMRGAFYQCKNLVSNASDIPNLSDVTNMSFMFTGAKVFNQDISNWDVSNVTNMNGMFAGASTFNQDIGTWNVANVTDMTQMFSGAHAFNQDIGNWDVANVTSMRYMFIDAFLFNKDIGNWNVGNVTNMYYMFNRAYAFNQDIGDWNVANVINMDYMFTRATVFNQDISNWNVSNVTDMSGMFQNASGFNQNISNWNVENVSSMANMFFNAAAFNQNIGSWNVSNVTVMNGMFDNVTLSSANYDALLLGWNSNTLKPNVFFSGGNSKYCSQAAINARANMIDNVGWTITDGGQDASCLPPTNNECAGAITLTCGTSFSGTTYNATDSGLGTPICAGGSLQDVFYKLNVIAGGAYTITVNGADYDGVLVTYKGSWGSLTELACADNGFSAGVAESITFTAAATETIVIRTYDWSTSAGNFTITVDCDIEDFVFENGAWSPSDPNVDAGPLDNITVIDDITSFTSDLEVNNITVMNGATLNVEGVLKINGDITNNGNLIFVSTATSNGELAQVAATSTIAGNVTVERYMKAKRSYRMVSSAVTTTTSIHNNWQEGATSGNPNPNPRFGTHITGSQTGQNGFDPTATGNYSMFTVNIGSQQFQAVTNTDVNTLTAGNPYLLFVRGDRSIDLDDNNAAGETVLGATGLLVTGTSTQNFATENAGDLAMFGNPYQSAVDVNSVFANSTNVNTGYYYVYDPSLGDNGAYVTVNLPGGTNTSSSGANHYLQPGQGAQLATLGAGSSFVVFNESDKTPGQFTAINRPLSGNDMLTVQLYTTENFNNGGSVHDSFGILFANGNDNGITSKDAVKPMNFYENLGIDNHGTYLSLEQRDMPQAEEVYSIYSCGYTHSEYILKLKVDGLDSTSLYLDDHFTDTSTLLETGENTYSFSIDASDPSSIATDRFAIRPEQRLGVDDNNLLAGIHLYPNPLNGNTFYINAPRLNGEELVVTISDLSGRRIFNQTLECRSNTVTVPMGDNLSLGVYMVTLKHGGESHTYRLIKE